MATLPPTHDRPQESAQELKQSISHNQLQSKQRSASSLPSWCSGLRKESLDSDRAYNERITTSTQTSEIRLRQESIRYWNRFLEEAQAAAFGKIVGPTCLRIREVLGGGFDEDSGFDENQPKQQQEECYGIEPNGEGEKEGMENPTLDGGTLRRNIDGDDDDDDDDWEYCQQLFGLPSASRTESVSTPITSMQTENTEAPPVSSTKSAPAPRPSNPTSLRICYPLEVLPIFVITSPLISNCLQDRSKICHSMWRQLNGLEETVLRASCGYSDKPSDSENSHSKAMCDDRTICLYLPRLLSSLTETLQVLWDGLLFHYENTHDAPSMDPDDPRYYSNPNELASKRHSYHVSKRKHYEAILDRKVTTESQKSKIGTKKQQSLQDFVLEFLRHVYEEPEEFLKQEHHERNQGDSTTPKTKDGIDPSKSKNNRPGRGNLIVLLEDPRILHPKVATAAGYGQGATGVNSGGASGKPGNSNLVQSQLLETLAVWRGIHGIPVSLVVFHSVGSKHEIQQNNVLLNPSFESGANGGRFGIRTIRCSIPLASSSSSSSSISTNIPPSMAFGLWSNYFLQATMGTPLPLLAPQRCHGRHSSNNNNNATEIFLRMCRDALQNETSCSKWVSSIRARLASNFYVRRGSFVWDALNPNAATMTRAPPLLSETTVANGRNIAADDTNSGDTGGEKEQQPFAIGNDDVQIFLPEFVAWFCSYHRAHTLLSSRAGDHKAGMTPSDKCEALLKCYRLLRLPTESKRCQETLPKRRKLSSDRDSESGGSLQFWWSISCSLLPLHFLSLTVANEGAMVLSNAAARGRTTASGSRKSQNDCPPEGEYKWVLERLADVYKQLSAVSECGNDFCRNNTPDSTPPGAVAVAAVTGEKTSINAVESGTAVSSAGDTKDPVERSPDFVEATLRRCLQRGIDLGGSDANRNRDGLASSGDGTAAIEEGHQRSIRQLTTMIREFIVLVTAFSARQNISLSTSRNEEIYFARRYKIRLGITETILEMNRLALGQVEAWTRQWMEFNPLMAASEEVFRNDPEANNDGDDDKSTIEDRPVNFRRRILDNLPAGSRQLYEVMEGRLSVDRDDWYRSFGGTVEDFAVGVWTLRKCGLIRPKKTKTIAAATSQKHERGKAKKRQEVISYEKVAVVWC